MTRSLRRLYHAARRPAAIFALMLSAALLASMSAPQAAAQDELPPAPYAYRQLDDPAKEAEAQALMETLRCLKCQSQSIADSDASMAGDMRHQVRSRIAAGEEPEEVRAWLITRYGDYVSYQPRISRATWPLFLIPLLIALIAGLLLWRRMAAPRREDGRAESGAETDGEAQADETAS